MADKWMVWGKYCKIFLCHRKAVRNRKNKSGKFNRGMTWLATFYFHQVGVLFGSTNGFKQYPWSHQLYALTATRSGGFIPHNSPVRVSETVWAAVDVWKSNHKNLLVLLYTRYFISSPPQTNITMPTPPNQSPVVLGLWRSCCLGNEARQTPLMWQ